MGDFWLDMRQAAAALRRAPRFALAAACLLALGIGGVAALFGPLYVLVLAPLPLPHAGRLVHVGAPVFDTMRDDFPRRRELRSVFSAIAAYCPEETQVAAGGDRRPFEAKVDRVTPEFFRVLGIEPGLGRVFARAPLGAHIAVVSNAFWRSRLGGASGVSALAISVDGNRLAVAGVMPPGFHWPGDPQIWAMGSAQGASPTARVIGRLQPGLSLQSATARLKVIASYAGLGMISARGPAVQSLHDYLLGRRRRLLWILWIVSLLFLLLACAGVGNLVLARGVRRRPEIALRIALGAGRARLIRQLLAESLLLSAGGALSGVGLALIAGSYLRATAFAGFAPAAAAAAPSRLALVALVVVLAVATTAICGLAPAAAATLREPGARLRNSSGNGLGATRTGRTGLRTQEWVVVSQLALALVFLVMFALLLRSLRAQLRVNIGFQPRGVALVRVSLPQSRAMAAAVSDWVRRVRTDPGLRRKPDPAVDAAQAALALRNQMLLARVESRLSGLREIESVGMMVPPPTATGQLNAVTIRRRSPQEDPNLQDHFGLSVMADANAFRLLRIHPLAGRIFTSADALVAASCYRALNKSGKWPASVAVPVVVNARLARLLWGDGTAVGKHFWAFHEARVVGVVPDVRTSLAAVEPTVYWPYGWDPWGRWDLLVKLRPGVPLPEFRTDARQIMALLAPWVPLPEVSSLQAEVDKSEANMRLALGLLACFAALGVLVAGLGVYANAARMAAARRREIGVRLALGARSGQILGIALWRSFRLSLTALPMGCLTAWLLSSALSHWLFKVSTADPASYLGAGVLLLALTLAAGYAPARRAARADPAAALRDDG